MFGNIDFCDLFNYLSIYLTVHLFMANLVTWLDVEQYVGQWK